MGHPPYPPYTRPAAHTPLGIADALVYLTYTLGYTLEQIGYKGGSKGLKVRV
jgi:hypothetical protein